MQVVVLTNVAMQTRAFNFYRICILYPLLTLLSHLFVPSDEELEEFHSNLGLRHHDDSSSLQQDFEFNSSDEATGKFNLDSVGQCKGHQSPFNRNI